MADELYESADPIFDFHAHSPFRISEHDNLVTMELDVPFADKSDLEVFRNGHELYVQLGPYRRSFILPDALHRRQVDRAQLESGTLKVSFGSPDKRR